ncbi:MAG: TldD/PmbA family protein [Candidatus Aminicenantes bacterium]|nr:TldD/PmbA family protein [Candidatus Aminicenantes bacterium]
MKKEDTLPILTFEDRFDLDDDTLQKILNIALSQGGDFSEIYLEYRIYSFINMEEDIIKETAESISLGLGIRVISGDKTGYGYTNVPSFARMKKAALTAASIASGNLSRSAIPFSPQISSQNAYPILQPAHTKPLEDKISLVKRAYLAAQKFDTRVHRIRASLLDQAQHIRVVNSEGISRNDVRPLIKLACLAVAEKGGKREAGYSGGGGRVGLEYFHDKLTPEEIGIEAVKESLHLLEAHLPPAGEMPVVLAPGHSGVLIHEAVGHLLEADFNRKKTSIFWDKMGKRIAHPNLNIYDDPTIPYYRGSYNIDDEGTIPRKTPLILEGKLVGLLQDKLSAKLMNAAETGHGRRQDYSFIPIPRMSNTYIDKGEYAPEEIVRSVDKGFYALKYQGGQVEDSGKFTFSVSSGYLIENGKLTQPVKQATLIGTNIDILNKIERIGYDLEFGLQTGTCGKEGQAAPVADGCPTLKISLMTVGGQ